MDQSRRNRDDDEIIDKSNNNNNSSNSSLPIVEDLGQELFLALRQAAVRCIHRFDQKRPTFFDSLFTLFCLYFTNIKATPFVKLIYDSQFREEYIDIEEFLANVLTTTSAKIKQAREEEERQKAERGKNFFAKRHRMMNRAMTQDEMKQLLDELKTLAEAVEVDKYYTKERIVKEKELRSKTLKLTLEAEEYFEDYAEDEDFIADDEDDNDNNNNDNDNNYAADDDGSIDFAQIIPDFGTMSEHERQVFRKDFFHAKRRLKKLKKHERLLDRCSFFGICKDFLESGQSVAKAVNHNKDNKNVGNNNDDSSSIDIHPAIADEAAVLVSSAGASQLPKIIDTLEVLALSDSPGIDQAFYDIVSKIAKLSLTKQQVSVFVERFLRDLENDPPPPPPPAAPTVADDGSINFSAMSDVERISLMNQNNRRQTKKEAEALMERNGEALGMDEIAFVDEVVLNTRGQLVTASAEQGKSQQQNDWLQAQKDFEASKKTTDGNDTNNTNQDSAPASATNNNNNTLNNTSSFSGKAAPNKDFQVFQNTASLITQQSTTDPTKTIKLVKPERFAKLITGYTNSRFNRTHYNHENPAPKHVMAYEFTLFYPGKRDPSKPPRFKVLPDGEQGWDGEYCYLEFDGEAPYAKVAYRIVNRKWDPRRTSASFDPSGKFRLYFSFKTSGYRR